MSMRAKLSSLPAAVTAPALFVATAALFVGLWRLSGEPADGFAWSTGATIAAVAAIGDYMRARKGSPG